MRHKVVGFKSEGSEADTRSKVYSTHLRTAISSSHELRTPERLKILIPSASSSVVYRKLRQFSLMSIKY